MSLKRKVAAVTGATQGIGLAIARALANEGCNLIVCGRNEKQLRRVEQHLARYHVDVLAHACDVRDEQNVADLFQAVRRKFRRIDILVNNAGIAHPDSSIAKLPSDVWADVIATNLTGMFLVTKAALPLMKRGGVIVNNLSIAAKQVFPGSSAYNASKHGALGFTNTLREELRAKGIRVIAMLPGATDTAIWNTLWPDAPRKKMLPPRAIAQALVSAVKQTEGTIEEVTILPSGGAL